MQTEEQKKKKKRKKVLKIVGALMGVLLLMSCSAIAGAVFLSSSSPPEATVNVEATVEALVQEALAEYWSSVRVTPSFNPTPPPPPDRAATAVAAVTSVAVASPTPRPTAIPTIAPPKVTREPVVLAEVSGVGDTVTDNFVWPQCQKAVFYWSTEPNSYGSAYLIAYLWKTTKDRGVMVVNAGESDMTEALTGEAFQPLAGGEYYFVTENTTGAWSITVVCKD